MGVGHRGAVRAAVLAGCVSCLAISPASGNRNAQSADGRAPVIRTTTSLVLVDALVQDRKTGAPVEDLRQEDFLLRDDGKPVEVTHFNRGEDQKLRPVQLWFVLMCNEERYYPAGAERQTKTERIEQWGAGFLAGKTQELGPALDHLRADDTVGVAHWCDNGQSEIDATPSAERGPALEAMEQIALRKTEVIDPFRGGAGRDEVARLINRASQTAFPAPFLALIFVGGREPANGEGWPGDTWSGFMEETSMDPALGHGSESNGATSYAIRSKDYTSRLAAFLDLVHRRYEIGFAPHKGEKKLHHIRVELTKDARERYPNMVLRYREVYSNQPDGDETKAAKDTLDWRQLDSRMRQAVQSDGKENGLVFEARRSRDANGRVEQFAIELQSSALTWQMLPNGDRRSMVTAVVASYSARGQPIGLVVKEFEIVQEFDRLQELKGKPISFSMSAAMVKGAVRVRLVVRDVATGHIGARDL